MSRRLVTWRSLCRAALLALVVMSVALPVWPAPQLAHAANTITVSTTADALSTDGWCSLREAVIAANRNQAASSQAGECPAGSGADTIVIPAGDYLLTRSDNGKEDSGSTGDLDLTESVTIVGNGKVTIIGGTGFTDRIFHVLTGNAQLSGVTLKGGNSSADGGGIFNRATLTLSYVTLQNNRTTNRGGGLANQGTATLVNVTLSDNAAKNSGGGLYNISGALNLNNVTVAFNTADSDANNTGDGGGVGRDKGTLTVSNSIIARNTDASTGVKSNDCAGTLASQGFNLIQSLNGCTVSGVTTGNLSGVDPNLGPLQDNPATPTTPTTPTRALLLGSPAIDAANPLAPGSGGAACVATDQRGFPRPSGARCDMGAFELQDESQGGPIFSVIAVVGVNDDRDDGACTFTHCSLREAIRAANSRPNGATPDQIIFNLTNPGGGQVIIHLTSSLPTLTDPVILDGSTQPGGALVLDGAGAGAGATGLNVLGGNSTLRGLTLSGFGGTGVAVSGAGGNRLEQCVITGSGGSGVLLGGVGGNRVANCTIFANGADGIAVSAGAANTFTINSLYDNGDLGIDLGNDGPTPPDIGDPDIGANAFLNGPVMLRAVPQGGVVQALGRFNGAPNTALTLEFFSVAACDPAGYGEGRTFLSSAPATTDGTGDVYFMPILSGAQEGSFVTATATDAAGNTSEFSVCMRVGPNNDTWPEALDLSLAGDPGAAAYSQHLDRQGQSRWFKFAVLPESRLIVTLTNLPANYDLTVYKDIASAFKTVNSNEDLKLLGAEFAPDAFSPDAFSPDAFSPDAFSPDAYSPDAFSPDAFSPDAYSPDAFSPDAFSPDAYSPDAYSPDAYSPDAYSPDAFSPDAYSPDAYSPDAFSPDAYSSAQQRSLVAVSAFQGTAGEGVELNTHMNTGEYYVRVRGRNGAFDSSAPFQLGVQLETGVCRDVAPITVPSSTVATAGGFRTIVLADWGRIEGTPGEIAELQEQLSVFLTRPEVQGVLVDVGADVRVAAATAQADQFAPCPYAKNLAAGAIRDIVQAYRAVNPLEYVVIIGNDDVIPFFRHPDQALLASEKNYVPPVRDSTTSKASLAQGYVLSQDAYGSGVAFSFKGDAYPLPDLAVGRLVETAAQASGMLTAYLSTANGTVATPSSGLVTGYDFLEDAARAVEGELEAGLNAQADTLIAPRNISPLDPASWTADDLAALLLGTRHDLVFLAGHFSANSALAADYSSRLTTADLVTSSTDFTNALIFSAGCHSGYNIVNAHGVPNVTGEPDWAQAFASKRATLIAGTGYQYGDTDFIEYSERLYREFSEQLRIGSGPVAVGKALVAAKQAYLAQIPQLRGIHEKALLEATLFGLPMLSFDLPGARLTPGSGPSIVGGLNGFAANPGSTLGLQFADVALSPTLIEKSVQLKDVQSAAFVQATYFEGKDGVTGGPTEPVLPLETYNVSVPGQVLRGVGFRSGAYADLLDVTPLTGAATTEIRGVHSPFPIDIFYPVRLWNANYLDALTDPAGGDTLLMITPAQFRSMSPGSSTGVLRRFGGLDLRLFYSNNVSVYGSGSQPALAAAPTIVSVDSTLAGGSASFVVQTLANPAAGVQEVWISYTALTGPFAGQWRSLDLARDALDSALWEGTLDLQGTPANAVRFIVQAVNGVGVVALDTNTGAYYVPGGMPSPTEPTSLALELPTVTGPYGSQVSFSAVLTHLGAALLGQPVTFRLGPQNRLAFTDAGGRASVTLSLLGLPGQHAIRASFAGDGTYIASTAVSPFSVTKQATVLTLQPATVVTDVNLDTGIVATLTDATGRRLGERTVFFVLTGNNSTFALPVITDFAGNASLGTVPLPAGTYVITAYFSGVVPMPDGTTLVLDDVRYEPSTARGSLTLMPPNKPPVCSDAYPSTVVMWSPDKTFHPINVMGITDPDSDDVTISITSIFQDERVGNKADGRGIATPTAEIRAERDGNGDGRVYHIFFTASDGHGGYCSGKVRVAAMTHDQGGDMDVIDGGAVYDSTITD